MAAGVHLTNQHTFMGTPGDDPVTGGGLIDTLSGDGERLGRHHGDRAVIGEYQFALEPPYQILPSPDHAGKFQGFLEVLVMQQAGVAQLHLDELLSSPTGG